MILLIHKNGKSVVRVLKNEQELKVKSSDCVAALWELTEKFSDEIIGWCEEEFYENVALENWNKIFHHNLVMASYAVKTTFLPESIGYVDQLPFINVNRDVKYPTWQMSNDVGGINGAVLLRFKELFENISNLNSLLNSVAKIGQQNGLLCYSDPGLVRINKEQELRSTATISQLFSFVYQNYNSIWTTILLWCLFKYEHKFPLWAYVQSFSKEKYFQKKIDLPEVHLESESRNFSDSIDVLIPTMGRPQYLLQVLEDLSRQSLLPKMAIIVEQNPEVDAISELPELHTRKWPFQIIHHFIPQTGACNARNIALAEVTSDWIFFADDDIRLQPDLLEKVISEATKYRFSAININCKQPGEETVFHKIKQWGSFGAGTSIVKSSFAKKCRFSEVYEHGFGEDADYGMQLRKEGCDIIYHPYLEIQHLKAPMGGFRQKPVMDWEKEDLLPKPSPTVMAFAINYYTLEQIRGYKTSLFIKFYRKQTIKNPYAYIKNMRLRWKKSHTWAVKLLKKEE
ncbi:glycosyltransferase family A protein [Salegentibacter sp. F188]|uniref:Glycosyltransferase family A protein n=1 Tax=Autumnicola patrickiae TaxID=3075591 RepID=A0ABU3DY60_9FLAO|nr:glycosyltransferase family A protein [Salegentibacter sp. F188]MDT0688588.1 glycosyltransferase family A protein [Salegentibacter sp. F188]